MAKVKYDVTNVEDITQNHAPVGVYRAKVADVDGPKPSSSGNLMLEVRFELTHDATGKASNGWSPVWYYPLLEHDHPLSQARWKEFLLAFGLRPKGTLDTDKLVGKGVQLRLKADTDQDGEYRPRVAKVMAMPEQDEPEEDEEEESEAEDDDVDLDAMDRAALKAYIKEEGLDVRVLKKMSDADIRAAILEAWPDEEDEEEPDEEDEDEEEDEEEPEAESDGFDEMSVADLKAELKERELPTNGAKKVLIARLRKDDGEEPF